MIGLDTSVLVQLEVKDAPKHAAARGLFEQQVLHRGEMMAVAPQVILEFLHVVTDHRRFPHPLTMAQASDRAAFWWSAQEVRQIFPTAETNALFLEWMLQHGLGRKRIIDTHLAATLWTAGVRRLLTSNPGDFAVFGGFEVLVP